MINNLLEAQGCVKCSRNDLKTFLARNYLVEIDPGPCIIGRYEEKIDMIKFFEEFLDYCGLQTAYSDPSLGRCYTDSSRQVISFGLFLDYIKKGAESLSESVSLKYILSKSDYDWLEDNYQKYNEIPKGLDWYENCKESDAYDCLDFKSISDYIYKPMILPTNPWTEIFIDNVMECILGCIESDEILSSKIDEFIKNESEKTIIYGVWNTQYGTDESIRCFRDKTKRDEYFKANKTDDYGDNLEKFKLPCLLESDRVIYGVYRVEDNYDYNEAKDLKLFGNRNDAEVYKEIVAKFGNDIVEDFTYHV